MPATPSDASMLGKRVLARFRFGVSLGPSKESRQRARRSRQDLRERGGGGGQEISPTEVNLARISP
eukprot:scaffold239262_cov19-Tisochrysis_lutea.AAC.1